MEQMKALGLVFLNEPMEVKVSDPTELTLSVLVPLKEVFCTLSINYCPGLKVNQREKLTSHNYLERDFRLDLQFNREIIINAMIHRNWLKPTESE